MCQARELACAKARGTTAEPSRTRPAVRASVRNPIQVMSTPRTAMSRRHGKLPFPLQNRLDSPRLKPERHRSPSLEKRDRGMLRTLMLFLCLGAAPLVAQVPQPAAVRTVGTGSEAWVLLS